MERRSNLFAGIMSRLKGNTMSEDTNVTGEQNETTQEQQSETIAQASEATKPEQETALEEAVAETTDVASGKVSEDVEGYKNTDGSDVYFDGQKVVEVFEEGEYPVEAAAQPGFKFCKMSDATYVHVPEGLFN